jgi:Protein of unknown function (DUF1479)
MSCCPTHTSFYVRLSVPSSRRTQVIFSMLRIGNSVGFLDLLGCDSDMLMSPSNNIDISSPGFPGIFPQNDGYVGPQPTPFLHPHLRLDDTMTSMPKVNPGDTVFWHCDLIHSVEQEHTGTEDSAGMTSYRAVLVCTVDVLPQLCIFQPFP